MKSGKEIFLEYVETEYKKELEFLSDNMINMSPIENGSLVKQMEYNGESVFDKIVINLHGNSNLMMSGEKYMIDKVLNRYLIYKDIHLEIQKHRDQMILFIHI